MLAEKSSVMVLPRVSGAEGNSFKVPIGVCIMAAPPFSVPTTCANTWELVRAVRAVEGWGGAGVDGACGDVCAGTFAPKPVGMLDVFVIAAPGIAVLVTAAVVVCIVEAIGAALVACVAAAVLVGEAVLFVGFTTGEEGVVAALVTV